jgi:PKD repeat protein
MHTYTAAGTYTVCLTVTDSCDVSTICDSVTVAGAPCVGPTASYSQTTSGLAATFTDATVSTAGGLTWSWDLGDGNTSTMQNPMHTYTAAGTYTVCLTVTDSCDVSTICDSVTVAGAPCTGPTAAFSFVDAGLTVTYTDASSSSTAGGLTWNWDLGDGNTSTLQSPVHAYTAAGSYLACLTATDSCGTDTVCDTVTITAVGVSVNDLELGLNVYPNPSVGMINVVTNQTTINRIEVLTVTGALVMDVANVGSANYQLDGSGLETGVYILRVHSASHVASRRVTLKKN